MAAEVLMSDDGQAHVMGSSVRAKHRQNTYFRLSTWKLALRRKPTTMCRARLFSTMWESTCFVRFCPLFLLLQFSSYFVLVLDTLATKLRTCPLYYLESTLKR